MGKTHYGVRWDGTRPAGLEYLKERLTEETQGLVERIDLRFGFVVGECSHGLVSARTLRELAAL